MQLNTVADNYEVQFDKLNHKEAVVKITAPSKANINNINGILYSGFSYFNEKKKYTWEYEEGWIDGVERIYNKNRQTIPIGLVPRAARYLQDSKPHFKISVSPSLRNVYTNPFGNVSRDALVKYTESLNLHNAVEKFKITPYDHQLRLIETALNKRRASLLACTSAGKSLSLYIGVRYLTEVEKKKNVLIIVPSSALVKQLYTDFTEDYGWGEEEGKKHCTLIYGESEDKLTKKQQEALKQLELGEETMLKDITISTWQSLQNKPASFFKVFDAVFVDEAHGTRGPVLRDILYKCVNSTGFIIGLSGTLPDNGLDAIWIEGGLGQKIEIVRLKELIGLGILTPVEVHAIKVPYDPSIRPYLCRQNYQSEYSLIVNNNSRKAVMDLLINSGKITTKENTVILYKGKDTLDEMCEYLKEKHPQFKYRVIKGEVGVEERQEIRRELESESGHIVIATYGTMKQGVNIKFLHNLVFAEFSKSMYEVMQSVGRVVRKHKLKKLARVFDICDDASYVTKSRNGGQGKLQLNYSMQHYETRKGYYAMDDIPIIEVDLSGIYTATIDEELVAKKKAAAKKRAASKAKKKQAVKGKGKKSKFLS